MWRVPSRGCTAVCLRIPGRGPSGWLGCFQRLVVSICVQVLVSTQVFISLGLKPSDGTASPQVSPLNFMRNHQTVFSSARHVGQCLLLLVGNDGWLHHVL